MGILFTSLFNNSCKKQKDQEFYPIKSISSNIPLFYDMLYFTTPTDFENAVNYVNSGSDSENLNFLEGEGVVYTHQFTF